VIKKSGHRVCQGRNQVQRGSLPESWTHQCTKTIRRIFSGRLQPMGKIAGVNDVVDAVLYLAHAGPGKRRGPSMSTADRTLVGG